MGSIDDDDGVLGDKSSWSEEEFDDEENKAGEDDANMENGNIDDGTTDVGKIAETIVIGRLGNKPPISATIPNKSISLSFLPFSFHSALSRFGALKPSNHSVGPELASCALYGSKFRGEGMGQR